MENNLEIIEVSTYQKNVVFEKIINFELNDIDYEYSYLQTDDNLYINITDEEKGLDILAIHNDEKYVNKLIVNEDLFNIIKSDADLSSFISEKTYSDIIKNGTDLSQNKVILSKEKEIEDNQER